MSSPHSERDPADDEIARATVPWPFPDDVFPRELGAVVMRDVLDGRVPALQVVHFDDGYWGIADGHHVPSERNLQVTHIWHVLEMDDTLAQLATLPPGHQADREGPGEPWVIGPHDDRPHPTVIDRIRTLVEIVRFGEPTARQRWVDRFGPEVEPAATAPNRDEGNSPDRPSP